LTRRSFKQEDPGSGRYYLKVKQERHGAVTCLAETTRPLEVTDLEGV
jgi:hypothetical protein